MITAMTDLVLEIQVPDEHGDSNSNSTDDWMVAAVGAFEMEDDEANFVQIQIGGEYFKVTREEANRQSPMHIEYIAELIRSGKF